MARADNILPFVRSIAEEEDDDDEEGEGEGRRG
jgi:hypothetical protein